MGGVQSGERLEVETSRGRVPLVRETTSRLADERVDGEEEERAAERDGSRRDAGAAGGPLASVSASVGGGALGAVSGGSSGAVSASGAASAGSASVLSAASPAPTSASGAASSAPAPLPAPPESRSAVQSRRARLASLASGAASGAGVGALLQPFDVVRTRMQLSGEALSPWGAVREATRTEGLAGLWKGTVPSVARLTLGAGLQFFCIDALRAAWPEVAEVEKKELRVPGSGEGRPAAGAGGDRGTAAAGAGGDREAAAGGVSSPEVSRSSPSSPPSPPAATSLSSLRARRAVRNFAIGGMARAIAATAACPLSVVKTRVEASGRSVAVGGALAGILRTEGPRGLFAGLGPTLASTAPFSALYYALYAPLAPALRGALGVEGGDDAEGRRARSLVLPFTTPATASALANFAAGAVAASVATVLTHPADVLRTHAQLAGTNASMQAGSGLASLAAKGGAAGGGVPGLAAGASAAPFRRPSSIAIARRLTAQQGLRWTMAGVAPRVAKRAVQTGLLWALYEELLPRVKRAIADERNKADDREA